MLNDQRVQVVKDSGRVWNQHRGYVTMVDYAAMTFESKGCFFFPYSNGRENLVDVYVAHWGAGKGKRSVRFDKPVLMDRVVINRSAKTSAWSLATVGRPAGTWNDPQQTQESDFSQLAMSVYKGCSYIFPSDPNQNPRKKHHHQSLSWLWITFINHC